MLAQAGVSIDQIILGLLSVCTPALVGYLLKRTIDAVEKRLNQLEANQDLLVNKLADQSEKIALNAQKDNSDYLLLKSEFESFQKSIQIEVRSVENVFNVELKNINKTLEQILKKLENEK
jgi:hypothetical protein